MASARSPAPSGSVRAPSSVPSWNKSRSGSSPDDPLFGGGGGGGGISGDRIPPSYEDVFGGPPRKSSPPSIDSIFDGFKDPAPASSSMPVYDKPVYDDDIFVGVPGVKSSSTAKYVDVFSSLGAAPERVSSPPYEDLLENLGRGMPESKGSGERRSTEKSDRNASGFEELIPGFGGSTQPQKRQEPENHQKPARTSTTSVDPFVHLQTTSVHQSSGSYDDPLEQISRSMSSGNTNFRSASVGGVVFDDFGSFGKSVPSFSSDVNDTKKDNSSYEVSQNTSYAYNFSEESPRRSSVDKVENAMPKGQPTRYSESKNSVGRYSSQMPNASEQNFARDQSPTSHQHPDAADDLWLTVSEIPLFTKPTSAPPPSRPPPPIAGKKLPFTGTDEPASPGLRGRRKDTDSFTQPNQNYSYPTDPISRYNNTSSIDGFEDFAKVKTQRYPNEHAEVFTTEEDIDANLRDAMGKAEAKFRHAKEVRERERDTKSAREYVPYTSTENVTTESQSTDDIEKQEQLDRENLQREREEKEKEQMRIEKERELELERERGRARQAVERATREARERAAAEARQKADKAAAEKARQQADRLAFQRAAAEARERAANEARERAEKAKAAAEREKAATVAREKAAAVAKEKAAVEKAAAEKATAEARQRAAERAAVERVAAEARDRAASEAKQRAAAAAKEKQNKTENDLEDFFGLGSRASSAPKQRAATSDNLFDAQFQSRGAPEAARSTSSGSNTNLKKTSSATNIVDDLSSIFGAPPTHGEFQEVDGETEDRRKARFERHQRTLERTAKALAEKNERDMQMLRDQAERNRIAETLDFEIKRWAAGKEGNLRALLSTLHYVLWPECGWQPVSLTDLITAASVKKVYRKATLCIHPDKVQQKGASLQQKYIAEKVFDLLKEAWNKFNSEELF